MQATPTSNAAAPRVRPAVVAVAALFMVATAGLTYFLVGLLDSSETSDRDYLWRPWPFLNEHRTAVGVVSVFVFVAAEVALVRARRAGHLPAPLPAQIAVLTLLAAWLGLGYGVVTAGVAGANIGGGMVLLVTPVFAVVAVVVVVGLAIRARYGAGHGNAGWSPSRGGVVTRRDVVRTGVLAWAVLGGAVSLSGLWVTNTDAQVFVGVASVGGLLLAVWAAVQLSHHADRAAGVLLALSAVLMPTFFAYIVNLPALIVGIALVVVPRLVLPHPDGSSEPRPA